MTLDALRPAPVQAVFLAAMLMAAVPDLGAIAQGLESEGAIETIVGGEVNTEEKSAQAESKRVLASIGNSLEAAQKVRRAFNIDEVDIIFLPEVGEGVSGIAEAREANAEAIEELQLAIEGSAIFYHALDSREILVRDVVALEFGEDDLTATIFVAGEAPGEAEPIQEAPIGTESSDQ